MIATAGKCTVYIDGPNMDMVLGMNVLGRKPMSRERPRWDRVQSFCKRWFGCDKSYFVCNANPACTARNVRLLHRFYLAIRHCGYYVQITCGHDGDPVDKFIRNGIAASESRTVVLFSHDGGYAPFLEDSLDRSGQVIIVGYREWMSSKLFSLKERGAEVLDIEHDLQAFDCRLERSFRQN